MQKQIQQRILDRMATSNQITPKQYAVMILRDDYQLTFREIAERMEINPTTAYRIYKRGITNEKAHGNIFELLWL